MHETGIVRITDTLKYTPKAFAFPKTTTEGYPQQAIVDIISIMKYPLKTITSCPMVLQQKIQSNRLTIFTKKHNLAPHKKFTVAPNTTTESE